MIAVDPIPKHRRTVFTRHGLADLGWITDEIAAYAGIRSGAIRLLEGFQAAGGGFGRAHIEAHSSRMKQLGQLGFRDAISYVHHVACAFDLVALHPDDRISVVRRSNGLFHQAVCQWDPVSRIWSVTTAIPKNSGRKLQIAWQRE